MVGNLFGDTVVYRNDVLMFKRTKTLSDVSFVDVVPIAGEPNVKILISSNILGEKHTWIPCDKILELNDDNGSPIENECNELTTANKQPKTASSNIRAIMPSEIGGLLIAIGGGLLYSNLDKECNNCDDLDKIEAFSDGVSNTAKIGYGCMILGGLMIAVGSQDE